MDFFDKLGKQASKTYKFTAKQTSKFAREAKLKIQMNEHKSQIEELYEDAKWKESTMDQLYQKLW